MRRKNKDVVTEILAGGTTSKLTCEKIASRTIAGVFAVALVATIAVSADKGITKERATTAKKADTSSSKAAIVTTSESTTTTMVTAPSIVTINKEATTTKAETNIEKSNSSSSPEVTTTTTTTVKQVEAPPIETYNAGNCSTDTWVEQTKDTTPTVTTVKKEASEDTETNTSEDATSADVNNTNSWDGPILNSYNGLISGPSGNETYYNLYMGGVIANMQSLGYDYDYWVRDDGVKMYGDYVMVAADLSIRPKGTIVETSLGEGIVCDTGGFVNWDSTRLDIATAW